MLRDDSRLLAIEPETYKEWLSQLKETTWRSETLADLRSPDAQLKLQPGRKDVGAVAVVSLGGFITQKPSLMSMLFGGTSSEALVGELRMLAREKSVGSILLDVASPGGSVFGISEAAAGIRELRGTKPIVAVANPMMASAAYWLAAQADEIVATPSSLTGSIGAMSVHVDETMALEKEGLKVNVFTHGERKAEEASFKPLTDDARKGIQARVDYYGTMFENDIAKARGVSTSTVRARYGQGAVFNARDALSSGLVDRIATFEDVLEGLVKGRKSRPRIVAEGPRADLDTWATLMGLTEKDSSVQ